MGPGEVIRNAQLGFYFVHPNTVCLSEPPDFAVVVILAPGHLETTICVGKRKRRHRTRCLKAWQDSGITSAMAVTSLVPSRTVTCRVATSACLPFCEGRSHADDGVHGATCSSIHLLCHSPNTKKAFPRLKHYGISQAEKQIVASEFI